MNPGTIWVTRPEPGNAITTAALLSAGFHVIGLPVLEVRPVAPGQGLPREAPDWIVFVSANAVRGLEAAGVPPEMRSRVHVAAVGSRTAHEAAGHGWYVELVPKTESADGLLELMTRIDMQRRRVWIPGGNREGSARHLLPETLRGRGALVVTFSVYETLDRTLGSEELARLNGAQPGWVIFHSPSAVEVVFSGAAATVVKRWQTADLVAIGPATLDRCRRERMDRVWECSEPSDTGLVALITSISNRMTEERRA